ncbi:zinc finger A20 and AN1 domain-containing stress-associated protein 7 isoform 2 [Oryza sativa Japonica Group]|uniref:zinc finger A20 and AN1 domain-containing stress-associated protein 7 isoform 2 n=1 Tax=Oryza sativa subsp. japonica TaxID=39947 RepID=UPI001F1229B5|nr:zinc finger A20 and AN1 domain-containing stress-associated protein 7 isoform 2 [Oryza sativa Japonica Group]
MRLACRRRGDRRHHEVLRGARGASGLGRRRPRRRVTLPAVLLLRATCSSPIPAAPPACRVPRRREPAGEPCAGCGGGEGGRGRERRGGGRGRRGGGGQRVEVDADSGDDDAVGRPGAAAAQRRARPRREALLLRRRPLRRRRRCLRRPFLRQDPPDRVIFKAIHWARLWSLLLKKVEGEEAQVKCRILEKRVMEFFSTFGWNFRRRIEV